MGFRKPDLTDARMAIGSCIAEIRSPYNDGFVSMICKRDLYLLKCYLEDEYARLPRFSDEKEWEQERMIQQLKQKEST